MLFMVFTQNLFGCHVCAALQVSKLTNGEDLSLRLVVHGQNTVARLLSVNISVQTMRYNGSLASNIQTETKEETLQPWQGDSVSEWLDTRSFKILLHRF